MTSKKYYTKDGEEIPDIFLVKVEHTYMVTGLGEQYGNEAFDNTDELKGFIAYELTASVDSFVDWDKIAGGCIELTNVEIVKAMVIDPDGD